MIKTESYAETRNAVYVDSLLHRLFIVDVDITANINRAYASNDESTEFPFKDWRLFKLTVELVGYSSWFTLHKL